MDKYQMMNEVGRLYDENERLATKVDRLTSDQPVTPDELLVRKLLGFARRELMERCVKNYVSDTGSGERAMDFDAWADASITSYMIPDELSHDDVKTVLDDELRAIYEDITRDEQEEDDE